MIDLQLNQDTARNLATRVQKGMQFWKSAHEFLNEEEIDQIAKKSLKVFRKIELFTDLEMEEIPLVHFSVKECKLLGILIKCCDRKLEKEFFKPMNQQLIALDKSPIIIKGYSEWRYMWKELYKRDDISKEGLDWFLNYTKSDLNKGHLFKCINDKINKKLFLVIPFSKTFKRAMGIPL